MGTKERRERERLGTRERILAAARDMFATEGYEAVTMRAIADRIEYTPTALYHHFPSKQALVAELCQSDFAQLAQHFLSGKAPADPIERLYEIGNAYIRFAEEHSGQYRFMFMTVLPDLEHTPGYVEMAKNSAEHNAYVFLRAACQDAIDQKKLREEYDDADMVAQLMWSLVHGIVSLRIVKHSDHFVPWKDQRETAQLAMSTVIRGMLRTP
jgi:AcrR family transcriptional regulator